MDPDYPLQHRPSGRKKYYIALMMLGGIGVLWVLLGFISFFTVWIRSSVSPAVVVGYEIAGGSERLRVQLLQDGRPKGFALLEARKAWPRFAQGQPIHVLTWPVRNQYGQKVPHSIAYAHRNHWQKHFVVLAIAAAAFAAGALGLARSRARRRA